MGIVGKNCLIVNVISKIFVLLLVELTMLCKDNAILGEIGHFQLLQHCALVVSGIDGTVARGLWNVEDLIFLC